MNRQTFITNSRVVMQAMVTLRSTTGVIISRIARSMASGTILSENNVTSKSGGVDIHPDSKLSIKYNILNRKSQGRTVKT